MSKNYCQRCAHTWAPRAQAMSRVCPACGSPAVTYLGTPGQARGCGMALIAIPAVFALLVLMGLAIIIVLQRI